MFSSIRIKLTLWYIGVLALVVIAFSATSYFILVNTLNRDTRERMVEMARNFEVALSAELDDERGESAGERAIAEAVNEMRFRDYQFEILAKDGHVLASTAGSDFSTGFEQGTGPFRDIAVNGEMMSVYRSSLTAGNSEYEVFVSHSLKEQNELKDRVAAIFLAGVPLTLILAGFGGYFLARKSLAPMVDMGRQAEQITAQNLSKRISIKNTRDELGDLARVFNELLARLDASFEQQRRFMADASHELRTPLAIVRGESEVALSKAGRPTVDYKRSLEVVHGESKRLTAIVEDLFTLARADSGQFKTNFASVYLDEIGAEAVSSMRVLANRKDLLISFTSDTEMPFTGDESLLGRLFLNVIDNAVKYTAAGGKVAVEGRSTGEKYRVTISDNGIGIPIEEQANIFERFYRVDKARSRTADTDTSGAGLGLSIAKWITEIHRGKLELASSDENGSVFSIEFTRPTPG